jgi:hypothetical protein
VSPNILRSTYLWAVALIVVLFLALNHMAGGRASCVIRPVTGIANRLLSLALKIVTRLFGTVFRLGGGVVKLPKPNLDKNTGRGAGPPPPRWKE